MNATSRTPSRRGLCAVYIASALIVGAIAVGLRLSVPEEVTGYVTNGLMLPAFRYGLLFPLIACGVILSGECRPIALIANLSILTSALWFGLQRAETIVLLYEPLVELIIGYPVLTTAMGMTTGGALLLPLRARKWFVPFVCAICGLCVGLFIIVESPADYYDGWFLWAAGLGCMAVVVVSMAFSDGARRIYAGSGLAVAGRIFGSWLIAASLMLAALAIVPERSLDYEMMSIESPDGIDSSPQPDAQRIFDATDVPPAQERKIGDVVNTPNGETFLWTGQGWDPVD
ncbi:MAG: hypothetical protein MPJ78_19485 [Hyphomicrobiaceae bacterium]|nr:hypothetical protein [Hyphomicrobiaceae bacterium]